MKRFRSVDGILTCSLSELNKATEQEGVLIIHMEVQSFLSY